MCVLVVLDRLRPRNHVRINITANLNSDVEEIL